MSDMIAEFVAEARENLDAMAAQLVRFESHPEDGEALAAVFRLLHSLKGACGFLGLPQLETMAHAGESLLEPFRVEGAVVDAADAGQILDCLDAINAHLAYVEREGREPDPVSQAPATAAPDGPAPGGAATIRISLKVLDQLMTLVPELVLTRNQLLQLDAEREDSPFAPVLQRLSALTRDIQASVTLARMQPIGVAWRTLPRLIRDLSLEVGKPMQLVLEGEDTELDRQVVELIRDPLTHMLRNAADHGLEPAAQRLAAGKPEVGTIRLSAFHRGGQVVVRIADDGRGLNTERIRAKAAERGLASTEALEHLSDAALHRMIFAAGFSTAEAVTGLSGRGVGMDVVQANVEALGGEIDVASIPGQGTTFTVSIPLTLAIAPALVVAVNDQRFAVLQSQVREVVRVGGGSSYRIKAASGGPVLNLRGADIPIVALDRQLKLRAGAAKAGSVLIVNAPGVSLGVPVDGVLSTEDVVVKRLPAALRGLEMFSGVTVLGDGAVVLIADLIALAGQAPRQLAEGAAALGSRTEQDVRPTQYLVFRAGEGAAKAMDIARIERVLRVRVAQLRDVGGQRALDYGGRLIPVLSMRDGSARAVDPAGSLLILADGEQRMALAADEIVAVAPARTPADVATVVQFDDFDAEVVDAQRWIDQSLAADARIRAVDAGRHAA